MTGFSAEWLALREPIDHAARNDEVISALCHYFLNDQNLTIADVGGGTGSTVRALQPVMPQKIRWHILDNDAELISVAEYMSKHHDVQYEAVNLANTIAPVFEPLPDLVTTSAFLDLVSETWLEIFVSEVTGRNVPFYAALSYDGRSECSPSHPFDEVVLHAFNLHQKTNKGFGSALGPAAAETARCLFENAGYTVFEGKSDWKAGPANKEFLRQLLQGWHEAASEMITDRITDLDEWLAVRLADIENNRLELTVGHRDLLAVPPEGTAT